MNIKCVLVERISKKGSPYTALEIEFNGYKKLVFLSEAELLLLRQAK